MLIYIIAAIIISTCELLLGLVVLRKNIKSKLNIIFFIQAFVMCLAIISLVCAQIVGDQHLAVFWFKVYAALGLLLLATALHFYFELTKITGLFYRIIGYIPVLAVSILMFMTKDFYERLVRIGDLWKIVYDIRQPAALAFFVSIQLYFGVLLFILIAWRRKNNSLKVKKQSMIFIITGILNVLLVNVNDFLLPTYDFYKVPILATLIGSTVYLVSLFFALNRFNLMRFNIKDQMEDILSNINEGIIAADQDGLILETNKYCQHMLSAKREKLREKRLPDIIAMDDSFLNNYRKLLDGKIDNFNSAIYFKSERENILTDSYFSRITDKDGDFSGILVIAKENLGIRHFKKLYKISARQMQVALLSIEGLTNIEIAEKLNIARRTVETHLFYIYRKLDICNKVELIKIINKFDIMKRAD